MLIIQHKRPSEELTYSLDIILNQFLGLDYQFHEYPTENLKISKKTSSASLSLSTSFFENQENYQISRESLPSTPLKQWNPKKDGLVVDLIKQSIPVLYGKAGLEKKDKQQWHLNLDIFGSAFFMLSRYEELVIPTRDQHDRFPASASLAFQEGFLDRPIIDEYTEILWTCLSSLWPDLQRKKQITKTYISCDVDEPFDCTVKTFKRMIRTCSADLIKRKSPITAIKRLNRYIFNKLGIYKFDPNYTFDWYMDICEEHGHQATFFFIPDNTEPNNGCYQISDTRIIALIRKIINRGHKIGVHGSYNTYNNKNKLIKQKKRFEYTLKKQNINTTIEENRQHYLRWDTRQTPSYLDAAGFLYDTTGSYPEHAGFRYGTSKEFSMWNWHTNKKLKLKQRPLIIMECSIFSENYMNLTYTSETIKYMRTLKLNTTKYKGNFVLLWHNSSFKHRQDYKVFQEMLK